MVKSFYTDHTKCCEDVAGSELSGRKGAGWNCKMYNLEKQFVSFLKS